MFLHLLWYSTVKNKNIKKYVSICSWLEASSPAYREGEHDYPNLLLDYEEESGASFSFDDLDIS